jgi:hypothetical protein
MCEVLASRAFYNLMYNFHVVLCFCSLLTGFASFQHIRFSFEAVKLRSSSDYFLLMAAKHSGARNYRPSFRENKPKSLVFNH